MAVIILKGPCPICRHPLKRSDLTEGKPLNPPELLAEAAMASLFMAESKLEVLLREARPAVAPSCPGALTSGVDSRAYDQYPWVGRDCAMAAALSAITFVMDTRFSYSLRARQVAWAWA